MTVALLFLLELEIPQLRHPTLIPVAQSDSSTELKEYWTMVRSTISLQCNLMILTFFITSVKHVSSDEKKSLD
jgi:hypothetical protein